MNIETTLTLIPVKTARQFALAIRPKANHVLRQHHRLHKNALVPLKYSHNDRSGKYSLYGAASRVSAAKGTIIDLFA